ncbi:MAG: Dabb family protein [Candidatus Omnitrophica bacterium]|nr:Dabb family protein [Candidatus Omnitrophota bacterium]
MHQHYVMFKLKDKYKKDLPEIVEKLKSLQDRIPLIRMSEVFVNRIDGPRSYDILFHAVFDSTETFNQYMKHPEHVPVQKYIEERVFVDRIADIDFTD